MHATHRHTITTQEYALFSNVLTRECVLLSNVHTHHHNILTHLLHPVPWDWRPWQRKKSRRKSRRLWSCLRPTRRLRQPQIHGPGSTGLGFTV